MKKIRPGNRIEFPMDCVFVKEVIICTKKRRGSGKEDSIMRVITEVFTKDGELIAEYDPLSDSPTP